MTEAQAKMLRMLKVGPINWWGLDWRTFRALLRRGYVIKNKGGDVVIMPTGERALTKYEDNAKENR